MQRKWQILIVEVEGSGLWLGWSIAMPLEYEMGCPEPDQIAWQLQQPEQVIGAGKLHTPLLQSHQQFGHVLAATR